MAVARRGLINMMEDMNEIPIEDVKRDLDRLNGHLDQIFHECSIREDDPDFKSTADGLKNMAANMDKINLIMLRSELENLQALLEDTSEWLVAEIFLHSHIIYSMRKRAKSGEMENEFRQQLFRAISGGTSDGIAGYGSQLRGMRREAGTYDTALYLCVKIV